MATLASLALAACGGDDGTGPSADDIRDFITALATESGVDAVFHAGAAPAGGSGPTVTLTGSSAMITGGSAIRTVTSAQAFSTIILVIDGVDGYWEITLPVPVTTEDLLVTLAQNIPAGTFTIEVAAGGTGGFGAYDTELVPIVVVGTGPLQVSVSWDVNSDVDLYVVEPGTSGEEIYFGNTTSVSGGRLDLDSNPACAIDNVRNENITWTGTPPSGTYTVRVNLYDACDTGATNYVVTLRRQSQPPLTYQGTLTGPGTPAGSGGGTVVTTFTY
jgi:hypothetical protein